ncbi:SRPBCC family protein [Adhaeribacter radiodurans]|uniref:SRPBCC domain-containing protein n=1 Tax=Adhaeribacter radiodurans TaxID=2745197 RepID=A0A7L7L1M0_9BACT|nr:SRPBCC domain-containing protein [Adhaeribacter radiodurans]QMU26674.1 SRPBCC domain-containing protein [Adhaeribacter radiodurans]
MEDYKITLLVDAPAAEVFKSINNVTAWWTENLAGNSQNLHDEFTVRFGDVHYSKQKLIDVIPDKKVVWRITDSNLNFIQDKQEWTNTKIIFEIIPQYNQTQISFTHVGLVPEVECFNACSNAWNGYIRGSLFNLITTSKGQPDRKVNQMPITSATA